MCSFNRTLWIERDSSLNFWLYTWQVWLGDLANEMKDTLKQLLVDCLNASKKGGSGGGVDPSKFPSQVLIDWPFCCCCRPSTLCITQYVTRRRFFHQLACPESYTLYYEWTCLRPGRARAYRNPTVILFPMVRSHFHIQMVSFHLFSTDLENEFVIVSAPWTYVKYNKLLEALHYDAMHSIRVQSG